MSKMLLIVMLFAEPQVISVALSLFPGVDAAKAGDKVGKVTLARVDVKPDPVSRDAWKALQPGAAVRFQATLDTDAVTLVTTSDIGGLVFLFVNDARLLADK